MSKQLALSSALATFAMAAMALFNTPDRTAGGAGDMLAPVQAGFELPDLPRPSLIR